jgi:hypothetical protein
MTERQWSYVWAYGLVFGYPGAAIAGMHFYPGIFAPFFLLGFALAVPASILQWHLHTKRNPPPQGHFSTIGRYVFPAMLFSWPMLALFAYEWLCEGGRTRRGSPPSS